MNEVIKLLVRSLLRLGQTLADIGPVEDVEDGVNVRAAQVLVLQVVRMLPHVNAKEGHQASGCLKRILILARGDLELGGVLVPSEPSPAGSLLLNI